MSISNHVLVGTALALAIKQPTLVLSLAFVSHFVIDLLPHFGYYGAGIGEALTHRLTYIEITWSAIGLIVLLLTINYDHWLTFSAAFVAVLPDLEWPFRYIWFERKGLKPPSSPIGKFHSSLQWGERPWGIIVEVIFFVVGYILIRYYLL